MPVNRNALIRYKTIDKCLGNPYRTWTLEDLIDACSETLYEYEGIEKGVSRRTVQNDIQVMRSDKLGYNAPIIVYDNKYYKYENPDYSITNMPLSEQDLDKLNEVTEILKQFKGFSHFQELNGMIQKLEDKVYTETTKQNPIIDIEKNENLKGLEYLDVLYNSILKKQVLSITYQSFKARQPGEIAFHPYLLKEFRNRWFVLGRKSAKEQLVTLALDRICDVNPNKDKEYLDNSNFKPQEYYKDAIGVTVLNERPKNIRLFIDRPTAPYVLTKPLHHSQQVISKSKFGVEISIKVMHNFELEKEILSFGDSVKVLSPESLRKRILKKLSNAVNLYDLEGAE